MKEEIIDILIPIYNSNKEYLRSSILSLKNQTTKNSIICILNGMDHNQNVKYTKLLKELKVDLIVECPYKGVAEALNYGFAFTRSEFIARQDDDDLSHPDRLYLQYQYMKKNMKKISPCGLVILQPILLRKSPLRMLKWSKRQSFNVDRTSTTCT